MSRELVHRNGAVQRAYDRAGAEIDVYPSHKRLGRPGLEPGTNALKGRCSTD